MRTKSKVGSRRKEGSMLNLWEWETLVASWRYFEHGHSISSASFPTDIVERYWGKGTQATDEDRMRIAHQFIEVDHHHGPNDKLSGWPLEDASFGGMDAKPWRRLWFFLDAVVHNGFRNIHAEGNGADEWHVCFRCDGKWVPRDRYIGNPEEGGFIPDKFVKEVR